MKPLIILTGPTAVGKTSLSIKLAKAISGEIISADSMQVYKKMDIGTAKITKEQMDGVPHHMIDIISPLESFDVATFKEMCNACIEDIYSRNAIPVIVGGTGFYIQAVLKDVDFTKDTGDGKYRKELEEIAAKKVNGSDILFEKLKKVDPDSALVIHKNNIKRVIRALEYYHQTGEPISLHNKQQGEKVSPYDFKYYVLTLPRKILYDRINERVDIMRKEGLVHEVEHLLEMGCTRDMVSMQALGYKEIIKALEGEMTLSEAYEEIKKETRHFAKRQFTWFKREKDINLIDKTAFASENEILEYILEDIKNDKRFEGNISIRRD